jgi:hypothetical protein
MWNFSIITEYKNTTFQKQAALELPADESSLLLKRCVSILSDDGEVQIHISDISHLGADTLTHSLQEYDRH